MYMMLSFMFILFIKLLNIEETVFCSKCCVKYGILQRKRFVLFDFRCQDFFLKKHRYSIV